MSFKLVFPKIDELYCGCVVWCADVICTDPIAVAVSGEELTYSLWEGSNEDKHKHKHLIIRFITKVQKQSICKRSFHNKVQVTSGAKS